MGWWKVQGTDDLVGDDPFDLLRAATEDVAELYLREFDRLPTRFEWQRLISSALEPVEELDGSSKEYLIAEKAELLAVNIVLEGAKTER
jgi:hypothetical protein